MFSLTREQLESVSVSPAEVLRIVEDVLVSLGRGQSVNPSKLSFETPESEGVVYAMAGLDAATRTVGFKSSYRFGAAGTHDAMRYHVTLALYDDRSGEALGFLDAQPIGALRTPAVSALLARAACPHPRTALVIGSGAQAQLATPFLVEACPSLERTFIFGGYARGLEAATKALSQRYPGRRLEVVSDLRAAAAEADIVIGATGPRATALVHAADLKPGSVAVLVGYGIDADALHAADYVIATHAGQMRATGADLAGADGNLPEVDAELPQILMGELAARRAAGDRVFAYNSGLVVTDIAVGRLFIDRIRADMKVRNAG
jgi:ornithine cyclodeaminase